MQLSERFLRHAAGSISRSDCSRFVITKFHAAIAFAFGLAVSSFGHHVSVVGGLIANEQVIRIYTDRVVASVQNVAAIGYGTAFELPREPMGFDAISGFIAKDSMPVAGTCSVPDPASIALCNLGPEPTRGRAEEVMTSTRREVLLASLASVFSHTV